MSVTAAIEARVRRVIAKIAKMRRPKIDKTMTKKTTTISFLQLPAELRNVIYRLVFHRAAIVRTDSSFPKILQDESSDFISPLWSSKLPTAVRYAFAFLYTCKQIHREASGIVYGENIIRIRGPHIRSNWHPGWLSQLKHVRMFKSNQYSKTQKAFFKPIVDALRNEGVILESVGMEIMHDASGYEGPLHDGIYSLRGLALTSSSRVLVKVIHRRSWYTPGYPRWPTICECQQDIEALIQSLEVHPEIVTVIVEMWVPALSEVGASKWRPEQCCTYTLREGVFRGKFEAFPFPDSCWGSFTR